MRNTPILVTSLFLAAACGETVNYDTQEKTASAAFESISPSDNATADKPAADSGSNEAGGSPGIPTDPANGEDGSGDPEADVNNPGLPLACREGSMLGKQSLLVFPEIAAGSSCSFGNAPNLSKRNGYFRAYLTQTQVVDLPKGAVLCGFSMTHQSEKMRYDDEMFFLVNDKLLLATKDYSEYLPSDGFFHEFSWDGLRNQVYDPLDNRPVYCAGGNVGMSNCKVPGTETQGSIELNFTKAMNQRLSNTLQTAQSLRFDWITTGDNDDSDCRHSPINLQVSIQYVQP